MDESRFPRNGRDHNPKVRDETGSQSPIDGEQADRRAPDGAANPSPLGALETEPRDPNKKGVRRILPWVIATVAVLVAAIAIGVLVVNESSEPRPVARLAAQAGPAQGAVPIEKEIAEEWDVTDADFVSYGSYGAAELWSTTTPGAKRCLGVVVHGSTWVFGCTAPTFDTVADIDIDPNLVPPAPSGEPTSNVRFFLHDDVVDVYLAPNPEGGFF
jgi:hypothetical protein